MLLHNAAVHDRSASAGTSDGLVSQSWSSECARRECWDRNWFPWPPLVPVGMIANSALLLGKYGFWQSLRRRQQRMLDAIVIYCILSRCAFCTAKVQTFLCQFSAPVLLPRTGGTPTPSRHCVQIYCEHTVDKHCLRMSINSITSWHTIDRLTIIVNFITLYRRVHLIITL